MRQKKVKQIRRSVYGEHSRRDVRYVTYETGERVCVGLRQRYLRTKRTQG